MKKSENGQIEKKNMNLPLEFAINLLWVRPGKVGGTEVVIRNLMNGFETLQEEFSIILVTTKDNADTFRHYTIEDRRFRILIAGVESAGIAERILWQNFCLNRLLRKNNLRNCFSPVYDRPFMNGGISYINTIHDIQAYHYPKYHPLYEVVYSKVCWMTDRFKSDGIVTISNFVAEDIHKIYHFSYTRMKTIYNPVMIEKNEYTDFETLAARYEIADKGYYYTVSQLIPHKNVDTLLEIMHKIKCQHIPLPTKLLISGINGNAACSIRDTIEKLGISDIVTLTGYISDEERNSLYRHAKAFLFASIFEGFGIPPIEAMLAGTAVVTTRCTCIPEVTQDLANYVNDPFDVDEWIETMQNAQNRSAELDIEKYRLEHIARQYMFYFKSIWKK